MNAKLLSSEENLHAAFYWNIKQCKFTCVLSMSVFYVFSLSSYIYVVCLRTAYKHIASFCECGNKLEGCRNC